MAAPARRATVELSSDCWGAAAHPTSLLLSPWARRGRDSPDFC
eukprot:CAMPEP_0206024816 /NCGR_PEP_ID=MMETSP1464-20131121/38902_1 /ASSEMBLY_ACC=CAM_ASM_001124 /TAXON_ID=119497 /ORGANISM="Exanthemachrysis gayraliae, Strain RCC1523" /LENGTH=42 /DNA_ID= /DNA_START= /DNA_END= /DNA_ORIENTATION=